MPARLDRAALCGLGLVFLGALSSCVDDKHCTAPYYVPRPKVDVVDAKSGARICDAEVLIDGMGKGFICTASADCNGPYDCGGPTLGGDYAIRVYKSGFHDAEEVVTFDGDCDMSEYARSIALDPE